MKLLRSMNFKAILFDIPDTEDNVLGKGYFIVFGSQLSTVHGL
jgi:hypothetical protein